MNLMDTFRRSCIRIIDEAESKDSLLRVIADMASETGLAASYSAQEIFSALKAREEISSTGFENGIAIPHCALEKAEEFIAGVLLVRPGVDFASADGKPSQIFVFLIGPQSDRNRHIQLLSAVSRMLSEDSTTAKFRKAKSEEELWLLLTRYIGELDGVTAPAEQKPKNLFTIIIQREEYFEEILNIFSAAVHGSITIIESTNAGHYLHRLPLFASYWSQTGSKFNRVIIAVVDRDVSNDVIRRINTRIDGVHDRKGVLVTVHELSYTDGMIDF
jgi:mannitol/fructose-specific phosphotransferase system IIA component (Ntr-type)